MCTEATHSCSTSLYSHTAPHRRLWRHITQLWQPLVRPWFKLPQPCSLSKLRSSSALRVTQMSLGNGCARPWLSLGPVTCTAFPPMTTRSCSCSRQAFPAAHCLQSFNACKSHVMSGRLVVGQQADACCIFFSPRMLGLSRAVIGCLACDRCRAFAEGVQDTIRTNTTSNTSSHQCLAALCHVAFFA